MKLLLLAIALFSMSTLSFAKDSPTHAVVTTAPPSKQSVSMNSQTYQVQYFVEDTVHSKELINQKVVVSQETSNDDKHQPQVNYVFTPTTTCFNPYNQKNNNCAKLLFENSVSVTLSPEDKNTVNYVITIKKSKIQTFTDGTNDIQLPTIDNIFLKNSLSLTKGEHRLIQINFAQLFQQSFQVKDESVKTPPSKGYIQITRLN